MTSLTLEVHVETRPTAWWSPPPPPPISMLNYISLWQLEWSITWSPVKTQVCWQSSADWTNLVVFCKTHYMYLFWNIKLLGVPKDVQRCSRPTWTARACSPQTMARVSLVNSSFLTAAPSILCFFTAGGAKTPLSVPSSENDIVRGHALPAAAEPWHVGQIVVLVGTTLRQWPGIISNKTSEQKQSWALPTQI